MRKVIVVIASVERAYSLNKKVADDTEARLRHQKKISRSSRSLLGFRRAGKRVPTSLGSKLESDVVLTRLGEKRSQRDQVELGGFERRSRLLHHPSSSATDKNIQIVRSIWIFRLADLCQLGLCSGDTETPCGRSPTRSISHLGGEHTSLLPSSITSASAPSLRTIHHYDNSCRRWR